MKVQKVIGILIVLALIAGCTAAPSPTSTEAVLDEPGFKFSSPDGWKELPAGQGLCETGEHCLVDKDGATMAVAMTALEYGCPGSTTLIECLGKVKDEYQNTKTGFHLISQEDFTSSFGLTGQVLKYTYNDGATQAEEFWTHNGSLKIRVRYAASPASWETLGNIPRLTFLSVRPNRPRPTPTGTPDGTTQLTPTP